MLVMFNAYAAAQHFISFIMLAHEVQAYCPVTHAEGVALLDENALHLSELRRMDIEQHMVDSGYPNRWSVTPCRCSSCTDYRHFQMQLELDAPDYWGDEDFLDQQQVDLDLDLFIQFTEHEDAEQTYYGSPAWLALELN